MKILTERAEQQIRAGLLDSLNNLPSEAHEARELVKAALGALHSGCERVDAVNVVTR